jgi:large subunit ribosomal protein L3
MNGILGKKLGMMRFFADNGEALPCTVIEAGPCRVVQVKTIETDGYNAVQLGFVDKLERLVNKPMTGHFQKAGVTPAKKLKEFREENVSEVKAGMEINISEIVSVGDVVKVVGISKGRGFQGVVKRHHFGGGKKTHGQSDRVRAPGSIGSSSYPSRVFKGMRMAGRMGGERVSVKNLKVVKIIPESNILFVHGSVPGHINSYVEIHKAK